MWTCTTSVRVWSRCTLASSAELTEARAKMTPTLCCAARRLGASGALCLCSLLALVWHQQAHAATLGSMSGSLGLFVPLAALLMTQALPAPVSSWGSALPVLGGTLLVGLAALLLWRRRSAFFALAVLSSFAPRVARAPCTVRAVAPLVALPDGFDREQLLTDLRLQYVRLQAAWDARELDVLHALTTPAMLAELCAQFPQGQGEPNCTEVVTLQATLLGFDELASGYLASVEFSGMIRERADAGAVPFRELWMLARPKQAGANWQLARQLDLPSML